jgi:hypothetical protein
MFEGAFSRIIPLAVSAALPAPGVAFAERAGSLRRPTAERRKFRKFWRLIS